MNSLLYDLSGASVVWWDAMVRATWQGAIALSLVWIVSRCVTAIPAAYKVWLWRLELAKRLVALLWVTPNPLAVLPLKKQTSLPMAPSPTVEVQVDVTVPAAPLPGPVAETRATFDGRLWLLA